MPVIYLFSPLQIHIIRLVVFIFFLLQLSSSRWEWQWEGHVNESPVEEAHTDVRIQQKS